MEVVPDMPPAVTVTVAVPLQCAVTAPLTGSTEAIRGSDELQRREIGSAIGTVNAVASSPVTEVPLAVSVSFAPTTRLAAGAVTATEASTGCTANWTVPSGSTWNNA